MIFVPGLLVVCIPHLDWTFNLVYELRAACGDGQVSSGGRERLLVRVFVPIGVAGGDAFVLPFARR